MSQISIYKEKPIVDNDVFKRIWNVKAIFSFPTFSGDYFYRSCSGISLVSALQSLKGTQIKKEILTLFNQGGTMLKEEKKRIWNTKIIFSLQADSGRIYYRSCSGPDLPKALNELFEKKGNRISSELKFLILEQFKSVSRWLSQGAPK